MRPRSNRIAIFLAVAAGFCMHEARARDGFSYDVILFATSSGLDGKAQVGPVSVDLDSSFGDLIDFRNIGGLLQFNARGESLSLFGEVGYVDFEEDDLGPLGNTQLNLTQLLAEAGVAYSFNDALAVYGGVRYHDLDNRVTFGGVESQDAQSWVDGMIGWQWTPVATNNLLLWARADIGGGGSDMTWLFETGAAWSWSESYAVYLAWRLLETEYQNDEFLYDVQQNSLRLGFGFRF